MSKEVMMKKGPEKKTTVILPEELWRRARVRAAETDTDLRSVVIEALELLLSRPASKKGGAR
jgi:hypothetical protein